MTESLICHQRQKCFPSQSIHFAKHLKEDWETDNSSIFTFWCDWYCSLEQNCVKPWFLCVCDKREKANISKGGYFFSMLFKIKWFLVKLWPFQSWKGQVRQSEFICVNIRCLTFNRNCAVSDDTDLSENTSLLIRGPMQNNNAPFKISSHEEK